jgi:hypothetical protein
MCCDGNSSLCLVKLHLLTKLLYASRMSPVVGQKHWFMHIQYIHEDILGAALISQIIVWFVYISNM